MPKARSRERLVVVVVTQSSLFFERVARIAGVSRSLGFWFAWEEAGGNSVVTLPRSAQVR